MKKTRYEKLRQHKHELKKAHANRTHAYSINKDRERNEKWSREHQLWNPDGGVRNNGYPYWHRISHGKVWAEAKWRTNTRIRSKYKTLIANKDFEEIATLKNSDYKNEYDLFYHIY